MRNIRTLKKMKKDCKKRGDRGGYKKLAIIIKDIQEKGWGWYMANKEVGTAEYHLGGPVNLFSSINRKNAK